MGAVEFITRVIENALSHPALFDLQQRVCNSYAILRQLFSAQLEAKGLRVLDMGCSTGACADGLLSLRDNAYTGIDLNERYLAYALKRRPHGQFLRADASRLDFPDESFDIVMLLGMLHHNEDAVAARCLAEAGRVLRPDGAILVAEPTFDQDSILSSFLLCLDRGRHIRCPEGYESLFGSLVIKTKGLSRTAHKMAYYVLGKPCGIGQSGEPPHGS
jgi:ubiquinone/menaquinone biosynthesis C-methylase UbiE